MTTKYKIIVVVVTLIAYGLGCLWLGHHNERLVWEAHVAKMGKSMNEKNQNRFAWLNDCAGNKRSDTLVKWKRLGLITLIWLPMLSGCASCLTHYDPVVIQPVSGAVIASSDASGYYQRVTAWRAKVKDYLETGMRD